MGQLRAAQLAFLTLISVLILLAAPGHFHFQPDTGIYVGGAQSLVEDGAYRFDGLPILIYYPGFSLLLAAPVALFGVDFQVLHLFAAAWAVLALWLVRAYYADDRHLAAGLLVPALLPFTDVFQEQVVYILSDAPFLALTFAALLAWRSYRQAGSRTALLVCALIVAFAPLVRLQGLFLWAGFALALAFYLFDRRTLIRWLLLVGGASLVLLLPFLLWTLRNYLQHTPETYNMFNAVFFGQESLSLYASDFHKVDWIDARWKYGIYNFLYTIKDLAAILFGSSIAEWVRLEAWPLLLGLPVVLGLPAWWRRATSLERGYFLISAAFIVLWSLRAGNLYTVPRYWLPLLPFVLLTGVYGLQRIYRLVTQPVPAAAPWLQALLVCLFLITVAPGTRNAVAQLQPWADHYHRASNESLAAVAAYVHERTSPEDVIAVTDWGVLPLALDRRTVSVLNDKDHVATLGRIVEKEATHLVILEGTSAMVNPTLEMVAALPGVFQRKLAAEPKGTGAKAYVYAIDLEKARAELQRRTGG